MPANEETMGESLDQETGIDNFESLSKLTPNKSNGSLEKLLFAGSQNGTSSSSFREEELSVALRSLPVRAEHEQFIRESVDLILNEAVFEVGHSNFKLSPIIQNNLFLLREVGKIQKFTYFHDKHKTFSLKFNYYYFYDTSS